MIKNSLTIALITYSISAFSQKPEQVIARVRYTLIQADSLHKNQPTENMLLFLGKNASLFTSYDKLNYEIADDRKIKAMAKNQANGGRPVAVLIDTKVTDHMSKEDYFFFAKENKRFTKETIVFQRYLYEEPVPQIKWEVLKDTLNFSGVTGQKAIANIENTSWTVWFAPSLPFQTGPWKLNGLPGLIIEAENETLNRKYQFAGFEKAVPNDFQRPEDITKRPTYQRGDINPLDYAIGFDIAGAYYENTIQFPSNAIKTTKKQVDKLKEAYKKDPKGFVKTQNGF